MFIKLSVIDKIFCKCKGFEKSQFYKINKPSSFLMSRHFATKRYLHGTSNPFPCFLLPMTSHVDCPSCLKKCQTSLDSVRSCNYCTYHVYPFDVPFETQGLFTCACATRLLAATSIPEWQLFRSQCPEVQRQFESGV